MRLLGLLFKFFKICVFACCRCTGYSILLLSSQNKGLHELQLCLLKFLVGESVSRKVDPDVQSETTKDKLDRYRRKLVPDRFPKQSYLNFSVYWNTVPSLLDLRLFSQFGILETKQLKSIITGSSNYFKAFFAGSACRYCSLLNKLSHRSEQTSGLLVQIPLSYHSEKRLHSVRFTHVLTHRSFENNCSSRFC